MRIWSLILFLLAGCGTGGELSILGVASPKDAEQCTFDVASTENLSPIVFDTERQSTLSLMLRVKNESGDYATPLRIDYRWECEPNTTTPVYLGAFSISKPFCLFEGGGNFVGFDIVPAHSSVIPPEATGLVAVTAIPVQLGTAFDDLFTMASLSNACCDAVGGCQNLPTDASGHAECDQLQSLFDYVAGEQAFDVRNPEDVERWKPFSNYDQRWRSTMEPNDKVGPTFPLLIRGKLEALTGGGTSLSSEEFSVDIGVCRACLAPSFGKSCTDI